jgi:hypothetical protein
MGSRSINVDLVQGVGSVTDEGQIGPLDHLDLDSLNLYRPECLRRLYAGNVNVYVRRGAPADVRKRGASGISQVIVAGIRIRHLRDPPKSKTYPYPAADNQNGVKL